MRSITAGAVILMAAAALPAAAQDHGDMDHEMHHAAPPESGFRAELIQDIEGLEQKYMGLARAMAESHDWRPADGVRSTGEVFGHVANANFMFPTVVGLEPEMEAPNFESMTGDALLEGLEHSFMHARHSIADVPDAELDAEVEMFGRTATKRQVLTMMVSHMHEHLGQAIAYARMNGVTPPWSR